MQGADNNELLAEVRHDCFFDRILAGMVQQRGFKDFGVIVFKTKLFEESGFGPSRGVGAGEQIVRDLPAVNGRLVEIWQNGHGCDFAT